MKKFVKIAAGRALAATGLLRRQMGEAGLIVAFHKVNDEYDDALTCSVADFERYCQFFSSCFDTISLNEFVTRLEKGRSIAGALAITFDDGYRDNFVHAAPVLKALDLPATFLAFGR